MLITGATGLIGRRLTEILLQKGCRVSHLSRNPNGSGIHQFKWDPARGHLDRTALNDVNAIVHLAGAGIADQRWTTQRKKQILESRVQSTRLLYDALQESPHNIKSFVSASAIGYYGLRDDATVMTEESPPGKDFLADVVTQWEAEADRIASLGIRLVKIRTGIVLAKEGGALKEIMKPIQRGVGAALGSGKQYMSWIHRDDLCGIFIQAIEESAMHGAYNAVAPGPVTNQTLTRSIARALHRRILLPPVPPWVLKVMLGEMAQMVLLGNCVSAEKILSTGFTFQYRGLETTLATLLS